MVASEGRTLEETNFEVADTAFRTPSPAVLYPQSRIAMPAFRLPSHSAVKQQSLAPDMV
jgi:hypothetical protein